MAVFYRKSFHKKKIMKLVKMKTHGFNFMKH